MQGNDRVARALWPALLLAVLAYVVLDFAQHRFLGAASEAAVAPEAHLTLWLAQTDASGEVGVAIRETAGSLLLYGRPATVRLLPGGSSRAVTDFLGRSRPAGQLLAVSSDTLADLARERIGGLLGDDPARAAYAQRLLTRAIPVRVISDDPLTIAVRPSSPIHSVAELLAHVRRSVQTHVFAITDDTWAADSLAALVQRAGVDSVVPYRVFPSAQDASLALAAGAADVVLAPRSAILSDVQAHRLRALSWPRSAGPPPRTWIELLAAPGTPTAHVRTLRRQLDMLAHNDAWRRLLHGYGRVMDLLFGARLHDFLATQVRLTAQLQQVALRVERR
jgi:hypothetical protein